MAEQSVAAEGRGELIWTPAPEMVAGSRLTAFAALARERGLLGDAAPNDLDYHRLHEASLEDLGLFWSCLAEFFGVELNHVSEPLGSEAMPGAEWFPGASTSYAGHLVRQWESRSGDIAIVAANEGASARPRQVTWSELAETAGALASALRSHGVGRGDHVASFMPNVPETVAAFLACASIGATWVSCSPDFGAAAVADRLTQVNPKVLFAVDGYRYGGREFDRSETVAEIAVRLGDGTRIVRFPYLGSTGFDEKVPGATGWKDFIADGAGGRLEPEELPFDHPLWVLFSSGTTGLPKGLVHSQGGILLEHLKWLGLHSDQGPGDRLLWLTTTGWTMWNYVVGGLLTGTTIVLYEGNPGHPDLDTIWSLTEEAEVTCLGAGAGFYHACMQAGLSPGRDHELAPLRALGSTGSPLLPEAFDWTYEEVGSEIWLFSTSGGTDVCSAFVGGTPWLGVRRGELQAPALGVDVQAWDPEGGRLGPGEVGELVVVRPMPSMPLRLVADPEMKRYRDAYFGVYPGVWRHGDWIEMTPSGGAIVHGRSDATINRGGIRIGTSEIYRALLEVDDVEDATVVETPSTPTGASEIILFVQIGPGAELDDARREAIRSGISSACSPRHVPDRIVAAPGIPRTLTGKVIETPIKRLLDGQPVETALSRDALADPSAIDWFADWASEWRSGSRG